MTTKPSKAAWLAAAIAVALGVLAGVAPAAAAPMPKAGTILEDQLGNKVDAGPALVAGHVVLVVSNEREAAASLRAWHVALKDCLPAGACIVLVADLRAVPFFVPRSSVAASLGREHPDLPILLDWKGALAAAFDTGKAGVAVECWQGGRRIARATGMPHAAALAQLGL